MPPVTSSGRQRLVVVADSSEGGLGAAAVWHANDVATAGWDVHLISPGLDGGTAQPRDVSELVPWHHWSPPAAARDLVTGARSARALRVALGSVGPSVVHVHGLRSFALTRLLRRRVFLTSHTFDTVGRRWSARGVAYRAVPRLTTGAFAVAPGLGSGWTVLLHASPRLRDLAPVNPTTGAGVVALWLGRLTPPKRPDIFVRAVAAAAQRAPVVGRVIGDGTELERCRALAAELAAPVTFQGTTRDVAAALGAADAFCLFSHSEGVPFALEEAMWCGLPVVLSPLPTLRDFAGDAALYADDAEAAAEQLVRLADAAERERLGAGSRERATTLLRQDAPVADYLRAYAAVKASW